MRIVNFSLILFLLAISSTCHPTGIIIADDIKQTQLFSTASSDSIQRFANAICTKYDKVILHLGRKYVFRSGNIFSSEIAKQNLNLFCASCFQKKIPIYLWFFDCYGGENFNELYLEHKTIIEENIKILQIVGVKYDGIAIDMEWINKENFDHAKKFEEVIKTLRRNIDDKKLFYFTSLIDNEKSNIDRGYDIKKLRKYNAQPITMLYLKDGGFVLKNKKLHPELNDSRVKSLQKFYKRNDCCIAFSLEKCVVLADYTTENIKELPIKLSKLVPYITLKKIVKNTNYQISEYTVNIDFRLEEYDNNSTEITKNNRVFYFEPNDKRLAGRYDFVWEYFILE